MKPRPFRVAKVCGIDIPIYRATVEQEPALRDSDGELLDGQFQPTPTPRIIVRVGLSKSVEKDTLIHEMGHALMLYSGCRELVNMSTPVGFDIDAFEEAVIRILTPHIGSIKVTK